MDWLLANWLPILLAVDTAIVIWLAGEGLSLRWVDRRFDALYRRILQLDRDLKWSTRVRPERGDAALLTEQSSERHQAAVDERSTAPSRASEVIAPRAGSV